MKRIIPFFLLCLFSGMLIATPIFVFAADEKAPAATTNWAKATGLEQAGANTGLASLCKGGATSCAATLIGSIIKVALGFIGLLLLGLILYAGFLWMTAGGDTKKVQEAKDTLKNAAAGVVIVVASYAIATYVMAALSDLSSPAPAPAPAGPKGN